MKYLLYLFDLDGTLVDSKLSIQSAMKKTLDALGVPYTQSDLDYCMGKPLPVIFKGLGIKDTTGASELYREFYFRDMEKTEVAYDGITDLLEALKTRAKMAVVTNKSPLGAEKSVNRLGLAEYFDFLYGDNGSFTKPDARVYDQIIRFFDRLSLFFDKKDVLMIGDSEIDRLFAKNAGIDFAFAEWGFFRAHDLSEPADIVLKHPMDLVEIAQVNVIEDIEITAELDLHTFRPKDIKSVVNEYLLLARERGFKSVRLIHGKGKGVQKETVRKILEKTPFITCFYDAPPYMGGFGATIAELDIDKTDGTTSRFERA